MPRMARQKSSTKVYHVILRGNAKQDIFLDQQDFSKFMKEICRTKQSYLYELYAYCLMTNHVHLTIYDKMDELSKILQSLTISFSSYWNKKYERIGHVFQNRFSSRSVETAEYLINLCRYIHQNPNKAGIADMENYQWSSYREYVKESKIIDGKQVLQLFDSCEQEAIKQFISFHKVNLLQDNLHDFMEYEIYERLDDSQARKFLIEILGIDNIQELVSYDLKKRNEYLKKLKGIRGISNSQIARLTGLSKRMIEMGKK